MNARASELFGPGSKEKHHSLLKIESQKNSCLICHKRGDVLVCSNWDCPIVAHESCMPVAAHFDDAGCFHCPYCLYKQFLVECHQAKEKATLANRVLVSFLKTRTRNDAGLLKSSKSLKRKKPDAPTISKAKDDPIRNKVECKGVRQSLQVGYVHQDTNCILETHSGNPTREDIESVKQDKMGNPIKENQRTSNPGEHYYNGKVGRGKAQEESREGYVCLTKENATGITEQLDEVKDSAILDDCFPRGEMVENAENADQPAEVGTDCYEDADGMKNQGEALQDAVRPAKENIVGVRHYSGSLTRNPESARDNPETKKTLEQYDDELVKIEQTHTELLSTKDDDKKEIAEESGIENHNSFRDGCFIRSEIVKDRKDVDRIAFVGEDHFGMTDEGKTWVKSIKKEPHVNGSASHEEFGSADDSESCNIDYLEHGLRAGQKRELKKVLKNDIQHNENSGYDENKIKEYQLGKSRPKVESIKQIQRSTILPVERRRKLPWTVQEVTMLKNHKEKTREGYLKLFSKGTPNGNQVDSSPPLPLTQPSQQSPSSTNPASTSK
ncbi:uncharacterized protein LOC104903070 isoform X2 [Beta vulgaris subsp. vulgaris]|uniref:uncharacterized protein LOC104903070 isoform X2 n=1 Tax=Beta vulgaris subsp. vulgaris TaxID=3555 RepID=UPI0020371D0F|nr:uncharacterized protein LOC104903070 isoform X2 [Beta vulgaris subsp. vulgaris]